MANPANPTGGSNSAADQAAKTNDALWYTFQGIGRAYLIKRGSFAATDADFSSVHGYSTIEQAQANPNSINTVTQLTISQWNEWESLTSGVTGKNGVIETVNITAPGTDGNNTGQAQYSTPQNPTTAAASQDTGLQAIADFFKGLESGAIWIRGAKIIIGAAMMLVGIAKITGADKALGGVVAGAVKAAPLL